jgi:hypothetical protein
VDERISKGISLYNRRDEGAQKDSRRELPKKNEQEKILKDWVKKEGILIKDDFFKDKEFLDKGEEAKVYAENDSVYKVVDYSIYSKTPLDYLNRLKIHNELFPETSYQFLGIKNDNGKIKFVIKQPYIRFKDKANEKEVYKEMTKRGFYYISATQYTLKSKYITDDYIVEDLHKDNVIMNDKGELLFIDPISIN